MNVEEFILKGLESPEHINTKFKLNYDTQSIIQFKGSYLRVKGDCLTFISEEAKALEDCSFLVNIIGRVEIPIKHIYYLELSNSYNWKLLVG